MNKLCYPYASELNPLLYQMSKDDIEFSNSQSLDDINKPEVRTVKVPGNATPVSYTHLTLPTTPYV